MAVIDMQTMRYINLLDKTSGVKTRKCFIYNNIIYFAVPGFMIGRAKGNNSDNIRIIQEQLGKKIKIIKEAGGINEAERFISDVVSPVQFKSLEVRDNCLILTAGSNSKAALIGRNRRRYDELAQIIEDTFGMEFKIV